jgi:hypothetical protein
MIKKALFAALISLSAASTQVSAETLNSTQLAKLFPGNYSVLIFGRYDLNVKMKPNGTVLGRAGKYSDSGRWSVDGNKLCIAWSNWTKGKKGCSTLRKDGNWVSGRGFKFRVS